MKNINEVNEFASIELYPYTACIMIFGPHDTADIVYGETEKVAAYFRSHRDIKYKWHQYETEEDMQNGIKEITSKHTPFTDWVSFRVEDCQLGEIPPYGLGNYIGNPAPDEMSDEYPYAICAMLTGPFEPTFVIYGDASALHEYWKTQYHIDYSWHQYQTLKDMQNGLDDIKKKHTPFSYWLFLEVSDCTLKEKPPKSKGKKIESLSEEEATSEKLTYKTRTVFSLFDQAKK